jgi:excisionase family DNA binding protein
MELTEMQPKCISTVDAARFLGVSVGSVQKWFDERKLQGWKTGGGHRRVFLTSLVEFSQSAREIERASKRSSHLCVMTLGLDEATHASFSLAKESLEFPVSVHDFKQVTSATMQVCLVMPDLILLNPQVFTDLQMDVWVRLILAHECTSRTHIVGVCDPQAAKPAMHFRVHWLAPPVSTEHLQNCMKELFAMRGR